MSSIIFRTVQRESEDGLGKVVALLLTYALCILLSGLLPVSASAAWVLGLNNNYNGSPTLDIFDPNLSPVSTVDLGMSGRALRLIAVEDFFVDQNKNRQADPGDLVDLAFVAGGKGEIVIINITSVESPVVIGNIPMPGSIRELDIDQEKKWLYAGGDLGGNVDGGSAFYIIDISNPFTSGLVDKNKDEKDDRIIWTGKYLPPDDGEVDALRVDTDRQLIYVGTSEPGRFDIYDFRPRDIIRGTITYTYYKADEQGILYDLCANMPYNGISDACHRPVRGGVVELLDAGGNVVARSNTTESGLFELLAPADEINSTNTINNSTRSYKIVVKAALGDPQKPHVRVVDNTRGNTLYQHEFPIVSTISNNFNIDSGWTGSSYIEERKAAPFAILDTIYQAEKFVRNVNPEVVFHDHPLTVYWSKDNSEICPAGTLCVGTSWYINGTHYRIGQNEIYVLGKEDKDTDEYDPSMILHEWAHYFAEHFSRDDNPGGTHPNVTLYDPRLSFAEGFADVFAAMVLRVPPDGGEPKDYHPILVNTYGNNQGTADKVDISQKTFLNQLADIGVLDEIGRPFTIIPGPCPIGHECIPYRDLYNRNMVRETLWELYQHSGYSFRPIYNAMKRLKDTPAFVTLYSFLHELKSWADTQGDATLSQVVGNLYNGDAYQKLYSLTTQPDEQLYALLKVDEPAVVSANKDIFGAINSTVWAAGDDNKYLHRRFFKFSTPGERYRIEVNSILPPGRQMFFQVYKKDKPVGGPVFSPELGGPARQDISLENGDYVMEVGSTNAPGYFNVRICKDECR